MKETWKYYDDIYKVSNLGRVMWLDNGEWCEKQKRMHNGRYVVILKQKEYGVGKLVASLFVPNPNHYKYLIHIDGDLTNCSISNLKWSDNPSKTLTEQEAMQRIQEKHGDKFTAITEYNQANEPMQFKCNKCGSVFMKTPQQMARLNEPCKQCHSNKVDARRKERNELLEKERERRWSSDCTEHLIYLYEFEDGKVYVGETYNKKRRRRQHRSGRDSAVYQYSQESGLPIPEPIILEEGLTAREASIKEEEWRLRFKQTHDLLNKVKCGGLGGVIKIHTLEEAEEVASHYSTRKELKNACQWAYDLLEQHGKLPPKCKPHGGLLQRFQRRTSKELTIPWG